MEQGITSPLRYSAEGLSRDMVAGYGYFHSLVFPLPQGTLAGEPLSERASPRLVPEGEGHVFVYDVRGCAARHRFERGREGQLRKPWSLTHAGRRYNRSVRCSISSQIRQHRFSGTGVIVGDDDDEHDVWTRSDPRGLVCVTRLDLYQRPDYVDGDVLSFLDDDDEDHLRASILVAPGGGTSSLVGLWRRRRRPWCGRRATYGMLEMHWWRLRPWRLGCMG